MIDAEATLTVVAASRGLAPKSRRYAIWCALIVPAMKKAAAERAAISQVVRCLSICLIVHFASSFSTSAGAAVVFGPSARSSDAPSGLCPRSSGLFLIITRPGTRLASIRAIPASTSQDIRQPMEEIRSVVSGGKMKPPIPMNAARIPIARERLLTNQLLATELTTT